MQLLFNALETSGLALEESIKMRNKHVSEILELKKQYEEDPGKELFD